MEGRYSIRPTSNKMINFMTGAYLFGNGTGFAFIHVDFLWTRSYYMINRGEEMSNEEIREKAMEGRYSISPTSNKMINLMSDCYLFGNGNRFRVHICRLSMDTILLQESPWRGDE